MRIPAIFLIPNMLQTERLIDWEKEGWYADISAEEAVESEPAANNGVANAAGHDANRDPRLEPHYLL